MKFLKQLWKTTGVKALTLFIMVLLFAGIIWTVNGEQDGPITIVMVSGFCLIYFLIFWLGRNK